jgi:hypothetical protein
MTYGLVLFAGDRHSIVGEAVSHPAELVRGDSSLRVKAPSSAPSGHLLPKGRRVRAARVG